MDEPNRQESFIKEALQDYHDHIEIPDATPTWEKVSVRLQKRRRHKKLLFRLKIVAAVIAATIVIDLTTTTNIPATYASMSSLFREVKENIVEFFFTKDQSDTSTAKTVPPPAIDNESNEPAAPITTTLEDAKSKLSFTLLLPSYIPDHYALETVRIFREASGRYSNVYLEYLNNNEEIFKISQRFIEPGSTHVTSDVPITAGTIKEPMIGDNRGVLVILPEGFVTLEWLTADSIKVSISGKLTEDAILQMARSLD
ncbi:DUF4367 domain-containing protein [Paenibacillus sp. MMS18-CY102]|nr:DUF4367 domain-containing protein [Paenibacillus sp. MMS18-CY102]